MKKVGIMGGTFDPIHNAHLILAEQCKEEFQLDQILFIPTGQPPHKANNRVTTGIHRLKMVELAIKENSCFSVSDIELIREGNTYTAQTLEELHKQNPGTDFYFIMGADSLDHLDQWAEPQKIFDLSAIVVANRNRMDHKTMEDKIHRLQTLFGGRIYPLPTPNMDISSNYLRRQIANGKSIRYYIPDKVLHYIKENSLYKDM